MDVMLKINPKKTKIMIFQKRPRKSVDNNFKTGNEHTEIVQRYHPLWILTRRYANNEREIYIFLATQP